MKPQRARPHIGRLPSMVDGTAIPTARNWWLNDPLRLHPFPSCYKVRLLASLLDVQLELRAVDFHRGVSIKPTTF